MERPHGSHRKCDQGLRGTLARSHGHWCATAHCATSLSGRHVWSPDKRHATCRRGAQGLPNASTPSTKLRYPWSRKRRTSPAERRPCNLGPAREATVRERCTKGTMVAPSLCPLMEHCNKAADLAPARQSTLLRAMGLVSSRRFGSRTTVARFQSRGTVLAVRHWFQHRAAASHHGSGRRSNCSAHHPSGPGALPRILVVARRSALPSTCKLCRQVELA